MVLDHTANLHHIYGHHRASHQRTINLKTFCTHTTHGDVSQSIISFLCALSLYTFTEANEGAQLIVIFMVAAPCLGAASALERLTTGSRGTISVRQINETFSSEKNVRG